MCLHVPHSTDRLDLGVVGAPLVPVLEGAKLKQVLVSSIARILVPNPRSSGDLNARYSVLEAVRPQAGDVFVTDLHLTAVEVHTLKQTDLVILWIHANRPDGHEAIAAVAVGPGVPARVLSPLQDEHLTTHVLLLITHPGSTFHSDGANATEALLTDIATLPAYLHPATLEVLALEQTYFVAAHPHGRMAPNTTLHSRMRHGRSKMLQSGTEQWNVRGVLAEEKMARPK